MRKGLLFTVSGPSGVGKGSICGAVLKAMPEVRISISCTTRPPRPGEEHGREYFFISDDEYDRMVREDKFLEHAGIYGKRYGTPRRYVEDMLEAGQDVLLEIEMQGSMQVMRSRPETVGVFVVPPSFAALRERLTKRSTESEEQLAIRLSNAYNEMRYAENYDYILLNDHLDEAVDNLRAIITAERLRYRSSLETIENIKNSFEEAK